MRSVLFCNDSPIYVDDAGNHYGGAFDNGFFSKLFDLGDKITICMSEKKIDDEGKKKLSCIDLDNISFVTAPRIISLSWIRNRKKRIAEIEKLILEHDIVMARVPSMSSNLIVRLAKKNKIVTVVDVCGCPWDSLFNHSFKGKLLAGYAFLAQRKTVKSSDFAIYVTQKFLQTRYPTDGVGIGLSDVILEEENEVTLNSRIKKINASSRPIILGTTAAVNVKYKGQDKVIKALSILKRKGCENFVYRMVGGGDQTRLKNIAQKYGMEDKVIFDGVIPHGEIYGWLENIDIYIQPSYQEGLSRGLVEAMSKALPCIVSNVGGNPELIESKWVYKRWLFPSRKIAALLQKINTAELVEMASKNFAEAQKYQGIYLRERRHAFYEKILQESRSRN